MHSKLVDGSAEFMAREMECLKIKASLHNKLSAVQRILVYVFGRHLPSFNQVVCNISQVLIHTSLLVLHHKIR